MAYLDKKEIITWDKKADHIYTFELNIPLFYDYFQKY